MRTDNHCIAVLVAFALHSEGAFSLRHPSFEAEGIPLMLSRGGAFKRQYAKTKAGVSLVTHVAAVLHVITVKHAIINLFVSRHGDEMPGRHQEEREGRELDVNARAPGLHPASEGLSLIKDGAAGQRSQGSWVEYWLESDRPVNEGCRFESLRPPARQHLLNTAVA